MTAPYIVVRRIGGEVAIFELSDIKAGIPIYANPVTTEVRSETYALKLARQLTIGAEETEA